VRLHHKRALGVRGRFCVEGKFVWWLKNWIDRRFMAQFSDVRPMTMRQNITIHPRVADKHSLDADQEMRCGGCGAKVGHDILSRALAHVVPVERSDVVLGVSAPDDAAVLCVPDGHLLVHSVDFFRSFFDDPYVFGAIAAQHALSDIFAMGATPQSASAIVNVPFGPKEKMEYLLRDVMMGANTVLVEAGAALVGGHSGEGAELALGFAVQGLVEEHKLMHKSGLRHGDHLILTKPLGTGTILAANMTGHAKGRWVEQAVVSMLQSNSQAARIFQKFRAHSCTDVTGFGLLGHLGEMLDASKCGAVLYARSLPLFDGVAELIAQGFESTLAVENKKGVKRFVDHERYSLPVLFDPQTSGGLLAAVPEQSVDECLSMLHQTGYGQATVVAQVDGTLEVGQVKCVS